MDPSQYDEHSVWVKALNYLAATLGIGTFLGFVNIVIGVLSAVWLGAQLYSFVRYDLPSKREKLRLLRERKAILSDVEGDGS